MKHIVIIGQSVTAVKAIELLRAHDQEPRVTLVGFGPSLPALTERFPEWIARRINRSQVFYQNEDFYRNLRIEFINDKQISRINMNRRTVFFEDKDRLEADVMIIAGSEKNCFPEIKGSNKEGLFSLQTIDQVDELLKVIGHIDTVVIESQTLAGARLAQALAVQQKEVILCLPESGLFSGALDSTTADFMISLLGQAGVRILRNCSVQEVLGESDVKAVRLNMGKVLAAEVVLFPDALPDVRMYGRGGLDVDKRIRSDEQLQTSCESVYATDLMSDHGALEMMWDRYGEFRDAQAQQLFSAITGTEMVCGMPAVRQTCLEINGQEVCLIGDVSGHAEDVFTDFDETGLLRKRIFMKNNVVLGAVIVNNTSIGEHVNQLIEGHADNDAIRERLLEGCVKQEDGKNPLQPFDQQEDKKEPVVEDQI